jgi:competence protein ComEC
VIGSDNANSVTMVVQYAGRRLLLPGDLESPGLEDVIAEQPIDCDILMAPHHGSRRSDPPGFAAWSVPEWVVISGGAASDSDVEHTYVASGAKVLNTGNLGAVEFSIDSREITAATYLDSPRR